MTVTTIIMTTTTTITITKVTNYSDDNNNHNNNNKNNDISNDKITAITIRTTKNNRQTMKYDELSLHLGLSKLLIL